MVIHLPYNAFQLTALNLGCCFIFEGGINLIINIKISIKEQINQAKKEQGERNGTKPLSHKPPEL